ncbi:MAG: helix-turn-helix domain-containing protein [Bacteroidota bacterium]
MQSNFISTFYRSKLEFLYHSIFKAFGENLAYGYLHILAYVLFIYALSELRFFKNFFLPKDVLLHQNTFKDLKKIDNLFRNYFLLDKNFKNPQLTIEICAKELSISKKELIDYLKITKKGTFKELVNAHRVDEFKILLKQENDLRYDMVGLAKECGFASKSTFYRVFKDTEGITPKEFKALVFDKKRN